MTDFRIEKGPSTSTPGGANTNVQFNDSSAFNGDSGFTYIKGTSSVDIAGHEALGGSAGLSTLNVFTLAETISSSSPVYGINLSITQSGTGDLYGMYVLPTCSTANNSRTFVGVFSNPTLNISGAQSATYGMYCTGTRTAGTMTNFYGLWCEQASGSSITRNYAGGFNGPIQLNQVAVANETSVFWCDSSQVAFAENIGGLNKMLVGCVFTQTADKTVTNTVTETSIIGSGVGTMTIPANYFQIGKTLRLRVGGIYSTPIASTPSVLIKVKLSATTIATVTTTGLLSGASNLEFDGEVAITCRSTGASGTVMVHGDIEYATGVGGTISVDPLNNVGATTVIDTTASKLLDVTVTWDTNTTTRIIKSTIALLESLN